MQLPRKPQALRRRWPVLLGSALVPLLGIGGCESMSNTDRGLLTGGGLGAGAGALIGGMTHHAGPGALIGGALGAAAGGLTGSAIDRSEAKQEARTAAAVAAARPTLGLTDVAQMTQQGLSDGVIIEEIRQSGSRYNLSAQDLIWLKQNGVRDPVISVMQQTAYRGPRRIYTATPVYPAPVYVVEPAPPPPVGFGVSYTRVGRW